MRSLKGPIQPSNFQQHTSYTGVASMGGGNHIPPYAPYPIKTRDLSNQIAKASLFYTM